MKKIAFGCDPNAEELKQLMIERCRQMGYETVDFGSPDPIYASTAIQVADFVASGRADKGVLVCGTGIGVSISANKVRGAYAALISDVYSAQRAALSNDTNIACFGAFTLGPKLAVTLLETWLGLEFDPASASAPKVARIKRYEAESHRPECN